jgi:hypothetical protein
MRAQGVRADDPALAAASGAVHLQQVSALLQRSAIPDSPIEQPTPDDINDTATPSAAPCAPASPAPAPAAREPARSDAEMTAGTPHAGSVHWAAAEAVSRRGNGIPAGGAALDTAAAHLTRDGHRPVRAAVLRPAGAPLTSPGPSTGQGVAGEWAVLDDVAELSAEGIGRRLDDAPTSAPAVPAGADIALLDLACTGALRLIPANVAAAVTVVLGAPTLRVVPVTTSSGDATTVVAEVREVWVGTGSTSPVDAAQLAGAIAVRLSGPGLSTTAQTRPHSPTPTSPAKRNP